MGDRRFRGLATLESDDEPRILLENRNTDEKSDLYSSDQEFSGSDEEFSPEEFAQKISQLTDWDKAFLEKYFGKPYQEVVQSALSDETPAPRRPTVPSRHESPSESPIHGSCFKLLYEMTEGASREKCPELMQFLTEDLTQVLNWQKLLIKTGKDFGYDSRAFQNALAEWRKLLSMGAPTFAETLERLRNRQPPEGAARRRSGDFTVTNWRLSANVHRRECETLTMQVMCDATYSQKPFLLLELLFEALQHVQRRQQELLAAALAPPPTQKLAQPEQFTVGLSAFHPGVVNAEPNRCRRIGGKKWRCERKVVPGQKHCDCHMTSRGRQPAASSSAHLHVPTSQ